MATQEELRTWMRADFAADVDSLPNEEIDRALSRAALKYNQQLTQFYAARLILLDNLQMQAARDVDYTANETQESASQRFAQLNKMRTQWQADLAEAISTVEVSSGFNIMGSHKVPSRRKEYPNA